MESANSVATGAVRTVSKWQDGKMVLRHKAAGVIKVGRGFRRIKGFKQIPLFVAALFNEVGYISDDISCIVAA